MSLKAKRNIYECPHCHTFSMIVNDKTGLLVCNKCGVCADTPLYDETSEYRNFAVEHGVKDKSRTGYSGDANAADLGTAIQLTGSKNSKLLSDLNKKIVQDSKLIKLKKAMRRISQLVEDMNLGKPIASKAQEIYKNALDNGLLHNQKLVAVDAVCVYYACIHRKQAIDIADVLKYRDEITLKDFHNVEKSLDSLPDLKVTTSFAEVAAGFAETKLHLRPFVCDAILALGRVFEANSSFAGADPTTIAGALVLHINDYLLPGFKTTVENVLTVVGKSEKTVLKYKKEIDGLREQTKNIPAVAELIKIMKDEEMKR